VACDVPGRDRDLVGLIDAYVAIAQGGGGGQTVFVAGDEGSGRTALLRALATELERINPQPVVLAGAFRDGRFVAWSEEEVPVATAVDVVKNVVELAEALIPYAALVGQVLSKSQAAVELVRRLIGESERLGPTQFLPQLLRELCMRGPVVCLIDDADHAPAGLWGDLVLGLAGRIAAELRLRRGRRDTDAGRGRDRPGTRLRRRASRRDRVWGGHVPDAAREPKASLGTGSSRASS
jgi:AAA ATPase domain